MQTTAGAKRQGKTVEKGERRGQKKGGGRAVKKKINITHKEEKTEEEDFDLGLLIL